MAQRVVQRSSFIRTNPALFQIIAGHKPWLVFLDNGVDQAAAHKIPCAALLSAPCVPEYLFIYLFSPCGACFERNIASLGPVPICSRELYGTNGFTALCEGTRDRYNRARRRMGYSIPKRGSFHKGLVLLCRDKFKKTACLHANFEETPADLPDSDISLRISFTLYI